MHYYCCERKLCESLTKILIMQEFLICITTSSRPPTFRLYSVFLLSPSITSTPSLTSPPLISNNLIYRPINCWNPRHWWESYVSVCMCVWSLWSSSSVLREEGEAEKLPRMCHWQLTFSVCCKTTLGLWKENKLLIYTIQHVHNINAPYYFHKVYWWGESRLNIISHWFPLLNLLVS